MTEVIENLSCGVGVVRQAEAGWVTLLLRAYQNWDFPKGIRETGETAMEAAIREVGEEAGIHDLDFHWGDRFIDTGPYNHGKVARYHLAETTQTTVVMGISPETGVPEHQEYQWMDFDTAHDKTAPRVRTVMQWARQIVGA